MSGHSHWATIRRKKESSDAKKGQLFSKLSRQILIAVEEGPTDVQANPKLRLALEQAKNMNMPKEKIERLLKKAVEEAGEGREEVRLEAYTQTGVALFIQGKTAHRNRSLSELKSILLQHNCNIGESGSTAYIFDEDGKASFKVPVLAEDKDQIRQLVRQFKERPDVSRIWLNTDLD